MWDWKYFLKISLFQTFLSPDVGDYSDDTDVTVTLDLRNKGSSNDQEGQQVDSKGIKQAM